MLYYLASRPATPGAIPIPSTFRVRSFTQQVGAGVQMQLDFLIRETPTTSAEIPPGGATLLTILVEPAAGPIAGE